MDRSNSPTQRVIELVQQVQAGTPTLDEVRELQGLLAGSEALRRLYIDMVNLQGLLQQAMNGEGRDEAAQYTDEEARETAGLLAALMELDAAAGNVATVELRLSDSSPIQTPASSINESKVRQIVIPRPLAWLAVAAAIGLVVWLGWAALSPTTPGPARFTGTEPVPVPASDVGPADHDQPHRVGTIVASLNASWDSGESASVGQVIENRTTRLDRGLVQIRMDNGAMVTLQAPCVFNATSPDRLHLTVGKMVGRIPANAIGFTVETPTHHVIDLSTEFGVEVTGAGQTAIQVYQGQVAWRPTAGTSQATDTPSRVVSAGQSLLLDDGEGQARPFEADRFARGVPRARAEQVAVYKPAVWWSFDSLESGLILDRGTLGINVEAGFDAVLTDSRHGRALVFNKGSAAVTLNNTERIDLAQPFTIEAWVRVDAVEFESMRLLTNRGDEGGLGIGIGGDYYAGDGVWLYDLDGRAFRGGRTNIKLSFFRKADLVTQGELPVGEYAHIVAVIGERGLPRVYINAVPQRLGVEGAHREEFSTSIRPSPSEMPFVLGRNLIGLAEPFIGKVDELAIYPRALDDEQVLALYLTTIHSNNP